MAGQGQPPIKLENTKPSFNFSFASPDLRARQQSRGIYDDSSDDETPKKTRTRMAKVNAMDFRAGFGGSAFSNAKTQARSGLGSAVVKTEASGTTTFFGAATTVVSPSAFGSVLTSASMPASTGASSFFGSTATMSTTPAASVSPFQATAPQVPQSQATSGPFFTSATTQAAPSLALQKAASPASATAPFFTGTTAKTATAQAASGSAFQNPPRQASATTKTLSLFTDATSRAAQAAISSAFQSPTPQTSQAHSPFGPASLSSSTPTPAPTAPKATMAQTEDSRLFAAHMKLLDTSSVSQDLHEVSGTPLFTKKVLDHSEKLFSQYGFLAGMSDILDSNAAMKPNTTDPSRPADPRLFFNISAPSSAFICGSQGSGKSHTLSCLLENCLMKSDVSKLDNPLAGLVLHYDSFTSDVKGTPCEAAHISTNPNVKVRVLVSPTNLQTMKRTYADLNVTVEPLRINQTDLNTKRMMDLMAVDQDGGKLPLYLHAISRILRDMRLVSQQNNTGFNYREFKRQVDLCDMTPAQLLPLNQRLETLESFMPRSQTSGKPAAQSKSGGGNDFFGSSWSIKAGTLTIVDLSCPCVTAEGACALFNMCLSLFLEQHTTVGRVIGLDEAHKYMNAGAEASSLTNTLLSAIRLQRHLGTRVFISTQEPTISPKLLDLCSMTIVHRFTSPDWLSELRRHLASLDNDENSPEKSKVRLMNIFNQIVKLRVGEALLFAPSAIIGVEKKQSENGSEETDMQRLGTGYLKIKIRARVTSDGGRSVFAMGTKPTTKTIANVFGFPAVKPTHGVPHAGSGAVGGIKHATSPFQFPSIKSLNDSVLAASSATAVGSSASSPPVASFGAPSSAPVHTNIFGSMNAQATTSAAFSVDFGEKKIDPFKSSDRTQIVGAFTTSTSSLITMFSSSTLPTLGTRCGPFQPVIEREPNSSTNQLNSFQSIGFQLPYQKFSPEELRLSDYAVGVRYSGQWKFQAITGTLNNGNLSISR